MITKSDKLKRNVIISHEEPDTTVQDTPKWWSVVGDAIEDITGMVGDITRQTPENITINKSDEDNTALYIGIGAGVIVVVLLLLVLLKK